MNMTSNGSQCGSSITRLNSDSGCQEMVRSKKEQQKASSRTRTPVRPPVMPVHPIDLTQKLTLDFRSLSLLVLLSSCPLECLSDSFFLIQDSSVSQASLFYYFMSHLPLFLLSSVLLNHTPTHILALYPGTHSVRLPFSWFFVPRYTLYIQFFLIHLSPTKE